MSMLKEFREFAMKGSVVDLAVGVVIGAAFSKIVSSFVANIVMPPLNLITAKYGVNFKDLAWKIYTESPKLNEDGSIVEENGEPVMAMQPYPILNYGPFIQTVVDFLLIAFALFIAVRIVNRVRARFEEQKESAPPPEELKVLREIRDALQKS